MISERPSRVSKRRNGLGDRLEIRHFSGAYVETSFCNENEVGKSRARRRLHSQPLYIRELQEIAKLQDRIWMALDLALTGARRLARVEDVTWAE